MSPAELKRRTKRTRTAAFFFRGLVTLLPVVLTVFIFVTVYNFVATYVTGPINSTIYWSLESNGLGWRALTLLDVDPYDVEFLDADALTFDLRDEAELHGYDSDEFKLALFNERVDNEDFFRDLEALAIDPVKLRETVEVKVPPIIGLVLSLSLVFWIGWLVTGIVGRRAVRSFDRALHHIPVIRSVYPYAKQVVDFFLSDSELEFDTVVAVPYPSEGLWSIGFVTNEGLRSARESTGLDLVAVFVPSSPMPMTGYTIFVDVARLIPLSLSVDEALRVTVSGGVIVPPDEQVEKIEGELIESLEHPREDSA